MSLQRLFLGDPKNSGTQLFGFEHNFRVGDKVMVTKNDYKKEVFNGDIGFIQQIHYDSRNLEVAFDEKRLRFDFDELDKLTLAYAISIHKSQGSEYRVVIVIVSQRHLPFVDRNLIYTAVTRGQEQVFLLADPQALQTALVSREGQKRWEKLTEHLARARPKAIRPDDEKKEL